MRINKLHTIVIFLFLIIAVGLFYTQIIKGAYYRALSKKNCIRIIPIYGPRGNILDSNNNVIAGSGLSYNISVIPQEFRAQKDTIDKLSSIINIPVNEINRLIKSNLVSSFSPIIIARDAEKKLAIIVEENKIDLPGVIVQLIPERSYPYSSLAGHVIGYLSEIDPRKLTRLKDYGYKVKDIIGITGLEEAYDKVLRAVPGGTQAQVDHRGRLNKIVSMRLPKSGEDLRLTIDLKIQKIVEECIGDKKGAVVMLCPRTGKVLALASGPGFSPEDFLDRGARKKIESLLVHNDRPLFNRAISGQYPLGSVFKVLSAVACLSEKKLSPERRFICPGEIKIGNRVYACEKTHGSQGFTEAIYHSCNIFFYRLSLAAGPDILSDYAGKFGFGRITGAGLPYEKPGYVPSVLAARLRLKTWYDGDTANFGIGQGDLLASPIQAARFMAIIANGGRLIRPYLIEAIGNKKIAQASPHVLQLDKQTLNIVKQGMLEAVLKEDGTAHAAYLKEIQIAGKTGTAQVTNKSAHGWFVGFAPFNDPKIAFCVFLENCGSSAYAVGLAREIFEKMIREQICKDI